MREQGKETELKWDKNGEELNYRIEIRIKEKKGGRAGGARD